MEADNVAKVTVVKPDGLSEPAVKPSGMITTSERARELRARRSELYRQEKERQEVLRAVVPVKARRALAAVIAEAQDKQGLSAADALAQMAAMAAESFAANIMDKPREAVLAGKFAVGFTGYEQKQQGPQVVVAVQIQHIGADVAALADDVFEGEFKEEHNERRDKR